MHKHRYKLWKVVRHHYTYIFGCSDCGHQKSVRIRDFFKQPEAKKTVTFHKEHPILVLASMQSRGDRYAESLGLKNYIVRDAQNYLNGLKIRGVVITPGYFMGTTESYFKNRYEQLERALELISIAVVEVELG